MISLLSVSPSALHTSLLQINHEQSLPAKLLSAHFSLVKRPCTISTLEVCGYGPTIDAGTPSSLTPADLPLDGQDLHPLMIIRSLHLLKTKAGVRGNLQTCCRNCCLLLNGSQWGNTPQLMQDCETDSIEYVGKLRQRCWQLWCVWRGMHWRYRSLSYARMVWWKPLPGTELGLGLLLHRRNTHTQTRIKQILPWRSTNYPQWTGVTQTRGGPTDRGYHTYTPLRLLVLLLNITIFSLYLCLFS